MTEQAKPDLADAPAIVVFGRDDAKKPHASSFTKAEAQLAERAARLMSLQVLHVTSELARALAAQVPKGRVFATGKAFVPFIKPALFAELEAVAPKSGATALKLVTGPTIAGTGEPSRGEAEPMTTVKLHKGTASTNAPQPCGWADIRVGSIVLAAAPPRYTDWFECVVVAIESNDHFTLRYCDWPNEPPFVRRRVQLALMHPAHQPEPPLEPDSSLKAA